jgi:hypothetical protein
MFPVFPFLLEKVATTTIGELSNREGPRYKITPGIFAITSPLAINHTKKKTTGPSADSPGPPLERGRINDTRSPQIPLKSNPNRFGHIVHRGSDFPHSFGRIHRIRQTFGEKFGQIGHGEVFAVNPSLKTKALDINTIDKTHFLALTSHRSRGITCPAGILLQIGSSNASPTAKKKYFSFFGLTGLATG